MMSAEMPYLAATSSFSLRSFSLSVVVEGFLPNWSRNACRAGVDTHTHTSTVPGQLEAARLTLYHKEGGWSSSEILGWLLGPVH